MGLNPTYWTPRLSAQEPRRRSLDSLRAHAGWDFQAGYCRQGLWRGGHKGIAGGSLSEKGSREQSCVGALGRASGSDSTRLSFQTSSQGLTAS